MLVEFVLFLVTISLALYSFLTRNHDYWRKKGIPFVQPKSPLGMVHDQFFGIRDAGASNLIYYSDFHKQRGLRYAGTFLIHIPTLLVFDLDLCKKVLTKDFNYFVNRDFTPTTHEFISKHLFALEGMEWRNMRIKLTPTFTSGKMKGMFPLLTKCSEQLKDHIDEVVLDEGEFVVKDLIIRFTTDVIATCAFGVETNAIKNPDIELFDITKLVFEPKKSLFLKLLMFKNFPKVCKYLDINFFHPKVSDVLKRIIRDNIKYRKETGTKRNDFVDLLLEVNRNNITSDNLKDKTSPDTKTNGLCNGVGQKATHGDTEKESLTLEEMTAQAFVFFAAGFETAASTTSFCLFELAKNKEIQDRLRQEIDTVLAKHDGEITYQALKEMTYMDQVMNEGLRRYASFPVLTRVCTTPYTIPDTNLVIEKGVRVHIPSYAIHHDPDIYPDPFRFDPDRFSEENCRGRHSYSFLPFGEGPRNCIGMRFGRLQVKIGLVTFIANYEISPAPNTPDKIKLNPTMIVTTPDKPFSLKITKRTDK